VGGDSIIDVNITLGQWPMRRVPCDDPHRLIKKLREHHVGEVWAGSYDGLFHDDLVGVNNRLAVTCRELSTADLRFVPFGEINPLQSSWREEFQRCVEQHRMPGARLYPNYHGYKLDHAEFAALLKLAAEKRLVVQIVVLMEDERMMHPLLRVPPVDLAPLGDVVERTPGVRIVLLNALKGPRDESLLRLVSMSDVYVDIAMLEGTGALEQLVTEVPMEKVLFGSHAPSFYFESAILKLRENALPVPHVQAMTHENAQRILRR
jgi:uncharacterized protein